VAAASEISFGVYLAHPLVLDLLLRNGLGNGAQVVPAPLATVLAVVGALLGASLLTAAAARTPLSRLLTGRRRRSRPGRRVHETLSSRSGGSQDPRAGQLL
jgi:peptidoglycan/LPS O-acetylase OafA/YrhL